MTMDRLLREVDCRIDAIETNAWLAEVFATYPSAKEEWAKLEESENADAPLDEFGRHDVGGEG